MKTVGQKLSKEVVGLMLRSTSYMNPTDLDSGSRDADVRPDELLTTEERLARFGGKAGHHGPASAQKKAYLVKIPKDCALAWTLLARRLGSRPTTLMAQLVVAGANCTPDTYYAAISALQRSAGKGPLHPFVGNGSRVDA